MTVGDEPTEAQLRLRPAMTAAISGMCAYPVRILETAC